MCEIDRAKIACAIRWERDLTAGIRGAYPFAIPKIVEPVDPIDKEHARFGILVRGAQYTIPKVACTHTP